MLITQSLFKHSLMSRNSTVKAFERNITRPKTTKVSKINSFFEANPNVTFVKKYIPEKYLKSVLHKIPNHMYLICQETAKVVARHVLDCVGQNKEQLICETNPGVGLITQILLEEGVPLVRMFEQCQDFRLHLKGLAEMFPNRVELFTKDFYQLQRYTYLDKQDRGNRLDILLKDVPRRTVSEDPVMTVIGTMPSKSFLKYLLHTFMLQSGVCTYGRIQLFAFMHPKDYAVFVAGPQDKLHAYQYWSIISNLFLDLELMEKVPRNLFIPWSRDPTGRTYPNTLDPDLMYLVKINLKKEFPVPEDQFIPLFYFVRQLYRRGTSLVIPTVEKWVPGCGLNIIVPKLDHGKEYFEHMSIFTKMGQLNPSQILAVFKEVINFPTYAESPFYGMIENELLKMETIDSTIDSSAIERTIVKDLEMKLN